MMKQLIWYILFLVVFTQCVEPHEIIDTSAVTSLVVEGVFSNQVKNHRISLSRVTKLNARNIIPESNAIVEISDQSGVTVSLTEVAPGKYETPLVAAVPRNSYTLYIKTSDGNEYTSSEVPFKDGADISNVYARYTESPDGDGKGIQIYVDTEDPSKQTRYYRWNWAETYEVRAPFPSFWVWTGGNNVEYRYDSIGRCYPTDMLSSIIIKNTRDLEEDKVVGQKLRFIPEVSYFLRYRYSILVEQFCLSEEAFLYWDNLRIMSEQQGSLSDLQPGSVIGNISSVTNPDEVVLGYFEACRVSEQRIFLSSLQFYNEGMKTPTNFRSYCNEIGPVLIPESKLGESMPKYEERMLIWEVYGMSPGATFQLMPKPCCDCTDQGPTEKPSFF